MTTEDVVNDPFLTHSKTQPRTRAANIRGGDPYETSKGRSQRQGKQQDFKLGSSVCDFLTMMLLPWFFFVWAYCSLAFFQHKWGSTVWMVVLIPGVCSLVIVGVAILMRHGAFFVLGASGLFCILAGVFCGKGTWDTRTRQVYWMESGRAYNNVSGATEALSVKDAATLHFWDRKIQAPSALVDGNKAVGFVDDDLYCVAPVLSRSQIEAPVTWVQFWAVGINCCTKRGSFTCDDALQYGASHAVVPPGNSTGIAGARRELFEKAVKEAEGTHKVQSAPGAMLIRWVDDTGKLKDDMWSSSVWVCVLFSLIVLIGTSVLACAARVVDLGTFDKRQQAARGTTYKSASDYRSTRERADYPTQVP